MKTIGRAVGDAYAWFRIHVRRVGRSTSSSDWLVRQLLADVIQPELKNTLIQKLLDLGDQLYGQIEAEEQSDAKLRDGRRLGDLRRAFETIEALIDAIDVDDVPERRRHLVTHLGTALEIESAGAAARFAASRATTIAGLRRMAELRTRSRAR